ncbi:hypothetical protein PInf_018042 [Phytophthora infestans]|nr:hypothetical protein PInf_018042 [Phytophthora infestans]
MKEVVGTPTLTRLLASVSASVLSVWRTCEVTDIGAFAPEGIMLPATTVLQYVATSLKDSTQERLHLTHEEGDTVLLLEVLVKLDVVDVAWAPKMLGVTSSAVGSAVNTGGVVTAASMKEHRLDEIPVAAEDVGDAVTCLLHTILFTRAPGPVRPSEATCHAFPNITYALCAVGDVSRKVDHAVRSFEEAAVLGGSSYVMGTSNGMMPAYGQPPNKSLGTSNVRGANSGYIVVTFFERKVKKALFGLMSNEEKTVFEKWIIPFTVTSSPAASQEERELCAGETEAALQNALLHILTAVQSIEHIPAAMYDFEITTFNGLEEAQVGSTYGGGLGSASVRLMP